jgi:hypothetical protein
VLSRAEVILLSERGYPRISRYFITSAHVSITFLAMWAD